MIEPHIAFSMRDFEAGVRDVAERQLPFAIMLALNETVKGGRLAAQDEAKATFDRVTPFALRGIVYERATKQHLDARVVIHGDRSPSGGLPAAYFLGPQVHGGARSLKAFERQLAGRGLLPAGHVVVPAPRTPLDRYGNIAQGFINRVMAGLDIDYRGAGATRVASTAKGKRRKAKRGRYFVARPGSHLAPGVWHESGFPARAIYPVMLFVRSPSYAKRFDFVGSVRRYADARMRGHFIDALARAMRTAR